VPLDEDDVDSIIVGIFDLNRRLHRAVLDLHAIRVHLLDEEDDGEEEEGDY
jgi:hypothetical protein